MSVTSSSNDFQIENLQKSFKEKQSSKEVSNIQKAIARQKSVIDVMSSSQEELKEEFKNSLSNNHDENSFEHHGNTDNSKDKFYNKLSLENENVDITPKDFETQRSDSQDSKYEETYQKYKQSSLQSSDIYQADKHAKIFGYIPDYTQNYFIKKKMYKLQLRLQTGKSEALQNELRECQMKIYFNNSMRQQLIRRHLLDSHEENPIALTILKNQVVDFVAQNKDDEVQRRKHFYRGLDPEQYHNYYDKLYIQHLDHGGHDRDQVEVTEIRSNSSQNSWTIRQDNKYYKPFNIMKLIACVLTTILYPYFTINGFPIKGSRFWLLITLEGIFLTEIILKFFVQRTDENGMSEELPLSKVSYNYLNHDFVVDLVVFLPFGLIFTYIDQTLKFVWMIKLLRIKDIQYYLSKRFFDQIISFYIKLRQGNSFEDEKKKNQVDEDLIYITQKIYISNIIKIGRLVICIGFIVYFVGQFWILFVQIATLMSTDLESYKHGFPFEDVEMSLFAGTYSFLSNDNWEIAELNGFDTTVVAMYYALTSLSTCGFGDFFPVTDFERLVCSLMLLSGVSVFSYVLGELKFMMSNLKNVTGEIDEKEKLEMFFLLLEKFNYGRHINHDFQNEIRTYMDLKWNCDKNNFLLTNEDRNLLIQLPDTVVTNIYCDFLYKDFLFKFRRFFNIRKVIEESLLQADIKGQIKIVGSQFRKGKSIPYPFYTFKDTQYCQFMIQLLGSLQIRQFSQGQLIQDEMMEPDEIIFIEKGVYYIGYEINKKEFLRRQFGVSTNIGGFQVSSNKRFNFIYKAKTKMRCLALRKEKFFKLSENFPFFCSQLRQKFWQHYNYHVYLPLMKLRNVDILEYNFRKDYNQVLYLHDKGAGLMTEYPKNNLVRLSGLINYNDFNYQIQKIYSSIDDNLTIIAELGLRITQKTEYIQQLFNDRLVRGIEQNNVQKSTIDNFHQMIIPFEIQTLALLYQTKPIKQVEFDNLMHILKQEIFGVNPFNEIKNQVNLVNLQNVVDINEIIKNLIFEQLESENSNDEEQRDEITDNQKQFSSASKIDMKTLKSSLFQRVQSGSHEQVPLAQLTFPNRIQKEMPIQQKTNIRPRRQMQLFLEDRSEPQRSEVQSNRSAINRVRSPSPKFSVSEEGKVEDSNNRVETTIQEVSPNVQASNDVDPLSLMSGTIGDRLNHINATRGEALTLLNDVRVQEQPRSEVIQRQQQVQISNIQDADLNNEQIESDLSVSDEERKQISLPTIVAQNQIIKKPSQIDLEIVEDYEQDLEEDLEEDHQDEYRELDSEEEKSIIMPIRDQKTVSHPRLRSAAQARIQSDQLNELFKIVNQNNEPKKKIKVKQLIADKLSDQLLAIQERRRASVNQRRVLSAARNRNKC